MSELNHNELLEWYSESMQKAVDRCKELKKLTGNDLWMTIGRQLHQLRLKGETMANAKALTLIEQEAGLDKHSALWATDNKPVVN